MLYKLAYSNMCYWLVCVFESDAWAGRIMVYTFRCSGSHNNADIKHLICINWPKSGIIMNTDATVTTSTSFDLTENLRGGNSCLKLESYRHVEMFISQKLNNSVVLKHPCVKKERKEKWKQYMQY